MAESGCVGPYHGCDYKGLTCGNIKRLTDLGTVIPIAEEQTPAGLAAVLSRDTKILEGPLKASGVVIK
jgi:hypothetical protein